ncbi:MAG TPA: sigma-54 dependent transcriptional regulator [Pyrinomonadaceae bacterium]|nr:sigma-54 dependent transcriptional regulator [Pyrinomonadaceae bacterium]
MPDTSKSSLSTEEIDSVQKNLPITAIVRAVCQAAGTGPDQLYEVMLKLSLFVEATAPTYGLSIWTLLSGQRPRLKWAEGLEEKELATGERVVAEALTVRDQRPEINAGDASICFVLTAPTLEREGAALYGLCIRPLSEKQVKDLRALIDVAHLAHGHVATEKTRGRTEPVEFKSSVVSPPLPGMVFSSRGMAEVARAVERIKDSDSTVLVTGESGTGKELIARAIHRLSRRSDKEFVPFNCSAAPAELIESMLFGHRRGTFTGALTDHEGLIRAAENGTLFLDEIGDLPLTLQPKLLRFLQEGEVHTLGERAPRKVNIRVIAATHKDLEQLVREKLFREDLYYRIATLAIRVPPLRERPEDVSALISHFLTYYSRRNDRPIAGITWEAIRILEEYSWPGNIRELAAEIERLVLYADENGHIMPEHISKHILPERMQVDGAERPAANLEYLLEDYERRVITETLKRHDCNVARASEALGLGSRQTLYKKLKRLAIDISDFLQEDNTESGLQFRSPQR